MCIYVITTWFWGAINCPIPLALLFSACIGFLYVVWIRKRLDKLLTLPYVMHLKRPSEGYNYICGVEALLEKRDEYNRGLLAGIVINHNRICDNVTCWCQEVKNAMSTRCKDPEHRGELKEDPPTNVEVEKSQEYQQKTKIGRWLLSLQNDIVFGIGQGNVFMNIMVSYIYYFYIGNIYQSLNYLDVAQSHKPTLLESFAIYIHRRRIEATMLLAHELNLAEGALPIDVMNTLEFSETYNSFLEIIQDCANTYQSFWNELMKDLPDSQKLSGYGKGISEKWKKIQLLFNKLLALMPKNMNYLYLFGLFIKYITNDSEEAKKIHQKLVYIRNSKTHLKGPEFEKFSEEGRAMMYKVSGSKTSIGEIKDINAETEKILGYSSKELKGSKINKLMCSVLAETHDGFVTKFYETLISNKVNHSTFQYMKEQHGFFMPVNMLVRIIPNITEGIEFCCLCYRNDTNPFVSAKVNKTRNRIGTIICDESFKVLGVTRSCARTLKLKDSLIEKGFPDSFIFTVFPILKEDQARSKLSESRGRVISYYPEKTLELNQDEEEDKTPDVTEGRFSKNDYILLWTRIVKQDYNDSKAVLQLILLDQVPSIDAVNYIRIF